MKKRDRKTLAYDAGYDAGVRSAAYLGIPRGSDEWTAYVCGYANGYDAAHRKNRKHKP